MLQAETLNNNYSFQRLPSEQLSYEEEESGLFFFLIVDF